MPGRAALSIRPYPSELEEELTRLQAEAKTLREQWEREKAALERFIDERGLAGTVRTYYGVDQGDQAAVVAGFGLAMSSTALVLSSLASVA